DAADLERFEIVERAPRAFERALGNLDRAIGDALLPREHRVEHEARLLGAAAAELDDEVRARDVRDLVRMRAKQAAVGAPDAVFGQARDRVEQDRPELVVEIFRRQRLLSAAAEPRADVADEAGRLRRLLRRG